MRCEPRLWSERRQDARASHPGRPGGEENHSEGGGGGDGDCIFDICVVDQNIRIRCWYVCIIVLYLHIAT